MWNNNDDDDDDNNNGVFMGNCDVIMYVTM